VTPQNFSKVIDRSKIKRVRSQVRELFQAHHKDDATLGLYFDGKKKQDDGKHI